MSIIECAKSERDPASSNTNSMVRLNMIGKTESAKEQLNARYLSFNSS